MPETQDRDNILVAGEAGVSIRIKVVPGASRDRVAGRLGDRLKVAVAAPPEAGKANAAVCRMLGRLLGVPKRQLQVVSGQTQPRKTIFAQGVTIEHVRERLGSVLD